MASLTPIKHYEIIRASRIQRREFEIRMNDTVVLKAHAKTHMLHVSGIDISSLEGAVIASVKLKKWSRRCLLHLGKPKESEERERSTWIVLDSPGSNSRSFKCTFKGRTFALVPTLDSILDTGRLGRLNFRLLDASNGQILAAWTSDCRSPNSQPLARIDYFEELGREVEVLSLVAMMGLREKILFIQSANKIAEGVVFSLLLGFGIGFIL